MAVATYGVSVSAGGVTLQASVTRTEDGVIGVEASLPAGKAVTGWTKTDADTAECTLPSGHGYSNGNFDVYWSGGLRYGVPGTISTNTLTLDGGSGTDFPTTSTTGVVVCRQVQVNVAIDGDALGLLAAKLEITSDSAATSDGHATFEDSAGDDIANVTLNANEVQVWDIEGGASNPFTGDPITVAYCSNGNSSYAATLKIVGVVDSTP